MPTITELPSTSSLIMDSVRKNFPDKDFHLPHTHTNVGGDDGILSPEQAVDWAEKLGISELGLTSHNSFEASIRGQRHAQEMGYRVRVPLAMEATLRDWSGHVLIYDVKGAVKPWRRVEELISETHDQGGVIIPAHIGYGWLVPSLSPLDLIRLRDKGYIIDACEAGVAWPDEIPFLSGVDFTAQAFNSLDREIRGSEIGGSDCHDDNLIGALTSSEKGVPLLEAISKGETAAIFTQTKGRKRFYQHLNFIRKCIIETAQRSFYRTQNRFGKISRLFSNK